MQKSHLLSLILLCGLSTVAMAEPQLYVDAGVGVGAAQVGKNQTIELISSTHSSNQYREESHTRFTPLGRVGMGIMLHPESMGAMRIGIGPEVVHSFSPWESRGVVWQGGSSDYANLKYAYDIKSTAGFMNFTLLLPKEKMVYPYVLAGIGVSHNRSYNYQETPLNSHAAPMCSPFGNHSEWSFAYQLGVGVAMDINPQTQFLLSYRLINFGDAHLGVSPNQTTSNTLHSGDIVANTLNVGIRYFFK